MSLLREAQCLNLVGSQRFSMKDLRCEKVVVYQDRAEVKRLIKVNLKRGTNQLVLFNVSNLIEPNSIRVQGQAQIEILDVNTQNRKAATSSPTESNESESNELNAQLKQLQIDLRELEKLEDLSNFKLERLGKARNYLNDFAANLSKHANLGNQAIEEEFKDVSYSNNFISFLDLYTQRAEQLDTERYMCGIELMKIRTKLDCIRTSFNQLSKQVTGPMYSGPMEISVLVDSNTDSNECMLHISYMVSNVSWTPKYDIRVTSEDKTMILNYYGMINQETGEDWNDTRVVLSTASPSYCGNVPELETQNVRIRFREEQEKRSERRRSTKLTNSGDLMLVTLPVGQQEAKQTTNELITNKICTSTFEIQENATIPSDENTHRVVIGELNLKPEFEYISVPRKYPNVFIKARVTNDTNYLILAGQANVFYDNTFVTRTELSSYSPQEEFYCSLGVDSGIRIDYKPVKKFIGQTGLINKFTNVTYTQVIEVRNTTGQNAKILIQDNIPLSCDEKIQVKLIEPNIKNNPNIRLNKMNNIEFELNLPSMKAEEILIKYNVEYHSDQEIEFF